MWHTPNTNGGSYTPGEVQISRCKFNAYFDVSGRGANNQTGGNKAGLEMGGAVPHLPQGNGAGDENWTNRYWATRIDEFHCNDNNNDSITVRFTIEEMYCNKIRIRYNQGNRLAILPYSRFR